MEKHRDIYWVSESDSYPRHDEGPLERERPDVAQVDPILNLHLPCIPALGRGEGKIESPTSALALDHFLNLLRPCE